MDRPSVRPSVCLSVHLFAETTSNVKQEHTRRTQSSDKTDNFHSLMETFLSIGIHAFIVNIFTKIRSVVLRKVVNRQTDKQTPGKT